MNLFRYLSKPSLLIILLIIFLLFFWINANEKHYTIENLKVEEGPSKIIPIPMFTRVAKKGIFTTATFEATYKSKQNPKLEILTNNCISDIFVNEKIVNISGESQQGLTLQSCLTQPSFDIDLSNHGEPNEKLKIKIYYIIQDAKSSFNFSNELMLSLYIKLLLLILSVFFVVVLFSKF